MNRAHGPTSSRKRGVRAVRRRSRFRPQGFVVNGGWTIQAK